MDVINSVNDWQGWWRYIGGRRGVLLVDWSRKVTIVMMTLLAFLHRKACSFSTGECCVLGCQVVVQLYGHRTIDPSQSVFVSQTDLDMMEGRTLVAHQLEWRGRWIGAPPPREAETYTDPLSISGEVSSDLIKAWQIPTHEWGADIPESANIHPFMLVA